MREAARESIVCIEAADAIEEYQSIAGWMRPHRPGTVHRLRDGLIIHRDFSDL